MNLEVLKQKNFNEPLESKAEEEFVSHECCCCKKIFENEIKLNDHEKECDFKKYQILKKSHGCFFKNCNKFFKKSTDLRKHERIHKNIRNFKCDHCGKDFVHQTSLKNHLLTHTKLKTFVCSICGISFSTNGNLKQHLVNHDKDSQRKFTCDICDKKFNRSSNLKEHLATHSKLKSHKCQICGKFLSCSSSLAKHKKVHDKIKPFPCLVCLKSFTQNSHLKKHLQNVHGNLKVCRICDQSFSRIKAFEAHLKSHEKPLIISNEILVASNEKSKEKN